MDYFNLLCLNNINDFPIKIKNKRTVAYGCNEAAHMQTDNIENTIVIINKTLYIFGFFKNTNISLTIPRINMALNKLQYIIKLIFEVSLYFTKLTELI